jgi:tRNA threonylcarbamoyl adenosine modification protein (Sua5/YciO/YrdC/YwlC family)
MHIIPIHEAEKAVNLIKKGAVFIYPSDTRYCLGCNALDSEAMQKLSLIKQDLALTVVAPSKKWIESNFTVKKAFLDKLPGPFTYILKSKKAVIGNKSISGTMGIMFMENNFMKIIAKANVPVVCTNVNLVGNLPAVDISKISPAITDKVNFIIDAGLLESNPSTIIDFTGRIPSIVRR